MAGAGGSKPKIPAKSASEQMRAKSTARGRSPSRSPSVPPSKVAQEAQALKGTNLLIFSISQRRRGWTASPPPPPPSQTISGLASRRTPRAEKWMQDYYRWFLNHGEDMTIRELSKRISARVSVTGCIGLLPTDSPSAQTNNTLGEYVFEKYHRTQSVIFRRIDWEVQRGSRQTRADRSSSPQA